ncbi:hypothetical protein BWK47_04260 [Synechocystis sp. CACIAM 05]|nr:hypothetical protein BWK47_04260 [Synechocystis sp. CACIAM 05]
MNRRLVESLAEAIIALPVEDYSLFQNTLMAKMIKKTPGICGGHACIRDTRIAVWTIISLINQGGTDLELLADFPGLTAFDLLTIKEYYQSHRQEIDNLIDYQDQENYHD